jgi:hypothetical protein
MLTIPERIEAGSRAAEINNGQEEGAQEVNPEMCADPW